MKKISDYLENSFKGEAKEHYALVKIWRQAVGETVANVSTPIKQEPELLLVSVNDNMWLNELVLMKDYIIERLEECGLKTPDIRFIYRHQAKAKPKPVFVARSITPKEERTTVNICRIIKDEKLRASAEKALRAYFGKYSFEDFIGR